MLRTKLHMVVLLAVLSLSGGLVHSQTVGELFASAKRLSALGHDGAALVKIRQVISQDNDNFRAYCEASTLLTRIGQRQRDFDIAKTNFSEAERYGKKAIDLKPDDPTGYFLVGHAIERLAEAAGDKNGLAYTEDIVRFAKHAIKEDNQHAGGWYVLGLWHYRLSTMRAGGRATANLLHGGIPTEVSADKAVRALVYANKFDDQQIVYHYDLARAYFEIGRTADSKSEIAKALAIQSDHPYDASIKEKCRSFQREKLSQ